VSRAVGGPGGERLMRKRREAEWSVGDRFAQVRPGILSGRRRRRAAAVDGRGVLGSEAAAARSGSVSADLAARTVCSMALVRQPTPAGEGTGNQKEHPHQDGEGPWKRGAHRYPREQEPTPWSQSSLGPQTPLQVGRLREEVGMLPLPRVSRKTPAAMPYLLASAALRFLQALRRSPHEPVSPSVGSLASSGIFGVPWGPLARTPGCRISSKRSRLPEAGAPPP
jgi:hypothetical protein